MSDINSRTHFFTPALRQQIHRFFLGLARSPPKQQTPRDKQYLLMGYNYTCSLSSILRAH